MNKAAIKSFAIRARQQLIESAKQKACVLGISPEGESVFVPEGLEQEDLLRRRQLLEQIRHRGFEPVMEQAAYSWFIRLAALRYLQVNGFLTAAMYPHDRKQLIDLCRDLNRSLPRMFRLLPGWAELLCPGEPWAAEGSPLEPMREIPEEYVRDQVQILGWLYQNYNAQRKDEVFAQLKRNGKLTKAQIPVVTQLFTPEWIVRYLVENSLGRLYIRHALCREQKPLTPERRILREQQLATEMGWRYYLPEAQQTAQEWVGADASCLDPVTIKVLDPCMGTGHILVYAFDVLMQIYKACGWSEQAAAGSILEHNLYGLDIDTRAGQLCYFAVMMKAGKYDSDILNGKTEPQVCAMEDAEFLTDALIAQVSGGDEALRWKLVRLRSVFQNAGEYGSLTQVSPSDGEALWAPTGHPENQQLHALLKQARLLGQKYDVVVTNPPYMGAGHMSDKLSKYVKEHYPHGKSDLYGVFLERCLRLLKQGGYQAMITQHGWMFLNSFEKLRRKLLSYDLVNMIHLGPRAFCQIPGSVVQTAGFVLRNTHTPRYRGTYCRLTAPVTQRGKEELFLSGEGRYHTVQTEFSKLPGSPVAYWLSEAMLELFSSGTTVGSIARAKQGIATANNDRYLRLWHECRKEDIFYGCTDHETAAADPRKWYPYNKGGGGRKWYGSCEYVIDWYHDGQTLCADEKAVIRNPQFFFERSVSWSLVSTGLPAFRFTPEGQLFDVAGMSCFSEQYLYYLLGLFNSKVTFEMLKVLSPTINYQCGDIANIPLKSAPGIRERVEQLVKTNVELSRRDWDCFEVSHGFKGHPLL